MLQRLVTATLCVVSCTVGSGCLMEMTLNPTGGGVIKVRMRLAADGKVDVTKQQMISPSVTVTNATMDKNNWAEFDVKFDDVTKLSTARFFSRADITLADGAAGTKALAVKIRNKIPARLSAKDIDYYGKDVKIVVHFPGAVVQSNATDVKDNTATWGYLLNDFLTKSEIPLDATYRNAPQAATPPTPGG